MSCSRACTVSLYAIESLHEEKVLTTTTNAGKLKIVIGSVALEEKVSHIFILLLLESN